MGWLWGSSDSKDDSKSQDPLRNLDPSLRDFLAKESPVKYGSSNSPAQPSPPPPSQTAAAVPSPKTSSPRSPTPSEPSESSEEPKVPRESLYQDGRYAHLWKNYKSLTESEAEVKTDQEKIKDVLQGYKYRKAEIGRAALENCALEQSQINECFQSGGWSARVTMCRAENKQLERCYTMQSKFLRALGYLNSLERPAEVDEQIQMHADTLYHRMLDQEKAIETARAEGKPIPQFPPILSSAQPAPIPTSQVKASELPKKTQEGLKKRLEGLSGVERELEEGAIGAEIRAGVQVGENLESIYKRQREKRERRKEMGKETMGDKISSWFGR